MLSPGVIWEHHYLQLESVTRKQETAGTYFKNRPQDLFIDQHILKFKLLFPMSEQDSVFLYKKIKLKSTASPEISYPPATLCGQDRGGS